MNRLSLSCLGTSKELGDALMREHQITNGVQIRIRAASYEI